VRAFGPEKFGEIAFAGAILGIGLIFTESGFNDWLGVELSQNQKNH